MSAQSTPPRKVGPYAVHERLGAGGMAEVYRGWDERLQRPVALKQVRIGDGGRIEEVRRRFRREARAVARLDHPAIVAVHDWIETDEADWLVMELVDGRTLRTVLAESGRLPVPRVARIGVELAEGLDAAHRAGILHRDLKPENVMLGRDGRIRILDFGIAKRFDPVPDEATDTLGPESARSRLPEPSLTREGRILGTFTAMSPEQAVGGTLDARSDLFALGSMLYELLSGRSPFAGRSALDTLRNICQTRQVPLHQRVPEVPEMLSVVIDCLLEKEPDARPATAAEVAERLLPIARGVPTTTDVPTERRTEQRPITLLAVGMAESLELGTADPDILLDRITAIEERVISVAERWQGHFEGRLGRHWVLVFGVPAAREDDAVRATRAALDLVADAADIGVPLRGGLHSGTVVRTVEGTQERLALGPTFDLAAALESRAKAGGVLASDALHGAIVRRFGWREHAWSDPAGREQIAWEVRGDQAEAWEPRGAFVGRDLELGALSEGWRVAQGGSGRVVLLSGEAGVGKSRLLHQLRRQVFDGPSSSGALGPPVEPRWLSLTGSTLARSSPFQPVVDLLRTVAGVLPDAKPAAVLEALGDLAREVDLPPEELVPYLAALLDVEGAPLPDLDARVRRRRIQEAVATYLAEAAELQPMVLVVEDLQWIDPSTRELLDLLVEQAPTVPLLLILTHRPEFRPSWSPLGHVSEVRLDRLSTLQGRALVRSAAHGKLLPDAVTRNILERADGVPLYLEELTLAVLESGQLEELDDRWELRGSAAEVRVPSSLRESLAARLDRLGPARHLAQVAAVVGRAFSRRLLAAVVDLDPEELDRALEQLVEAELVHRKGFGRRARYQFRHALIQDEAYASLLRRERRPLHRRIAEALRSDFPDLVEAQPEILAHHLEQSGAVAESVELWIRAGLQTLMPSAYREAEDHFRSGLRVVDRLEPGVARDEAELHLTTLLARALSGLAGYASPAVAAANERAEELLGEVKSRTLTVEVVWSLWAYHVVRSDMAEARAMSQRLESLAGDPLDQALRLGEALGAYTSVAVSAYFDGDFAVADEWSARSTSLDREHPQRQITTASPQDLGVNAYTVRALTLWHLGDGAAAVKASEEALAKARAFRHPYSYSFAATWSARLHQSRGDLEALQELAEEVVEQSEALGFFWQTQGWFFRGCALAEMAERMEPSPARLDRLAEAVRWMRRGTEAYRATGARLSLSYMLAQQAQTELVRGEADAARELLDGADTAAAPGREGYWRPELLRLRGRLARMEGQADAARASVRAALAAAEAAGDRAFTLRAARDQFELERDAAPLGSAAVAEARARLRAALDGIVSDAESRDVQAARRSLDAASG